jgi:hypothetical protein
MQFCHQYCRSRTNFATVAAIDAKSEPLEHDITTAGSPNKALVGALWASMKKGWSQRLVTCSFATSIAKEAIPPNIPEALGKAVATTCYVDADHAGCLATRRSHTGVLLYVNSALVLCHSKRQNTVEASTFGSEFIAAKTAVEMVEGLRYKLCMMGFPVLGPTSVLCDNQSIVTNASRTESNLSKKRTIMCARHKLLTPYESAMFAARTTTLTVKLRRHQSMIMKWVVVLLLRSNLLVSRSGPVQFLWSGSQNG